MKFKLKKGYSANIILVIALICSLIFAYASSFYMRSLLGNESEVSKKLVASENKDSIDKYVQENEKNLVEVTNFSDKVVNIITKENERFVSKIFDFNSGEELDINKILKPDAINEFNKKIEKLLYLKYPSFIADVLNQEIGHKVYYLKSNELIIYYYDFLIDPMPQEELLLHVNYNEIKDYLAISVNLDQDYQNEDGNTINSNKKLIALTFDDGPGPYTENLVDILIKNKSRATFFMLGKKVLNYKNSVLKVFNNNMEIAYHSYNHTNFKRQKIDEIKNEWNESNKILKNITGDTFHLIRPPYGAINDEIKKSLDAPFILWYVDTEDWRYKDVTYLTNYTLDKVCDGAIILFHDIHKTSVEAIEKILPELYVRGYQVVSVSDMAKIFNVSLENHQAYRHFTR